MDTNIVQRLDALEKKIDLIYASVEKTKKYFLWTLISSAIIFLLPLVGLVFAIPAFLSSYSGMIDSLTQ